MDSSGVHPGSDERLKTDIEEMDPEAARQLRPVSFHFRGDVEKKTHHGFIAQDIQKIFPDAVTEDDAGVLHLNYQELIAPLCALVQHQEERITQLEKRLETLEDKL